MFILPLANVIIIIKWSHSSCYRASVLNLAFFVFVLKIYLIFICINLNDHVKTAYIPQYTVRGRLVAISLYTQLVEELLLLVCYIVSCVKVQNLILYKFLNYIHVIYTQKR